MASGQQSISDDVLDAARILWDYHALEVAKLDCDFILAMGSHDERVAHEAARLALERPNALVVTSGGFGKVTRELWGTTEGRRFADIVSSSGVDPSRVLVEQTATNTGANITASRDLLSDNSFSVRSGLLVAKPYMRRRSFATACAQWSAICWGVTSPQLSFEDYPNSEVPLDRMIELMVGDYQRMGVYAKAGFQTEQPMPADATRAYNFLVARGFDRFVMQE